MHIHCMIMHIASFFHHTISASEFQNPPSQTITLLLFTSINIGLFKTQILLIGFRKFHMAEAFFKFLIENLSSLIHKEIGLIMGVDKEMKKLQSTLTTIQSVLEDAEAKQLRNKPIQNWLSKLNDIAYEIEDILDECNTEVSKLERKGGNFKYLKKILFSQKIGRRMKEMVERLDSLAAERRNFHLCEIVVPQSREVDCRRETGSILTEPDHVYGRDEDKEKIVDMLVNQVSDCEQLSVIPIIGVGGLGKTTLAQLVFNDERVSKHFDTKLWVCVSDNFDLKILLEAIIVSATGGASNLVQLDALQRRVWEVLNQKRYLLILDDVWNDDQESWVKLRSILVCGSRGASIVVTTRLRKVADIMRTLPVHFLEGLSEENLWLLFKLRAFGRESEAHPNLETIGRQIVKKCAGVPLAAKALGGLLRFKRKENEWIHVNKSEIWDLPEEETIILPALRLSYHHLPLELRRCFAYCAVFAKDSRMEKQDLIFHWMAHRCISSNGVQEVEDIGEQIWNELVLRSFFQEVYIFGTRTTFKMHDLVHDLAQSIMENKVPGSQMKNSSLNASNIKVRNACSSRYHLDSSSSICVQVSNLTTIMNYPRLKILQFAREGALEKFASAIGELKHLQYLDLSHSDIRSFPRTFYSLWNLQILILNGCYRLESLPKHIRYMTNLRHIFLDGCSKLSDMPSRMRDLTSLKTLDLFIVGHKVDNQVDQLELLNLGWGLKIRHLERTKKHMNAKKANLVEKPNLRYLVFGWGDDRGGDSAFAKAMDEKVLEALEPHPNLEALKISGFKGSYFPLWMTKMENLTDIRIRNCRNCSHLPLGYHPHLKSMSLWGVDGLEYIVDQNEIQSQTFPSLISLQLGCLSNLKGLVKEEVHGEMVFPNLGHLDIRGCELLMLPPALPNLGTLSLDSCSPLTLSSFFEAKLENLQRLDLDFGMIKTASCILEDAWEGLCCLRYLCVTNVGEQHLSERWFRGLKYLEELRIMGGIGRSNLERWLLHLTALEKLHIESCSGLKELPEDIKHLHLLKRLTLENLLHMVSLPQALQHLPSLQSLSLASLPQLASLPEWLPNLTSLTSLNILFCSNLTSLPSTMPNLGCLTIYKCPKLTTRCEKEKGEDWHKIAHIPGLRIS